MPEELLCLILAQARTSQAALASKALLDVTLQSGVSLTLNLNTIGEARLADWWGSALAVSEDLHLELIDSTVQRVERLSELARAPALASHALP